MALNPIFGVRPSGSIRLLDEDDFASDSALSAASQQSIKAYLAATFQPISPDFTSTDQTVTADNQLDVAHGLAVEPSRYRVFLKCTTTDQGWAVGDKIDVTSMGELNTADQAVLTFIGNGDTTNVSILTGVGITILNKTSFNGATLTLASWRFVVEAWK